MIRAGVSGPDCESLIMELVWVVGPRLVSLRLKGMLPGEWFFISRNNETHYSMVSEYLDVKDSEQKEQSPWLI
jgi:hypothetical protein